MSKTVENPTLTSIAESKAGWGEGWGDVSNYHYQIVIAALKPRPTRFGNYSSQAV